MTFNRGLIIYFTVAFLVFGYVSSDPRYVCDDGAILPTGDKSCAILAGAVLSLGWPLYIIHELSSAIRDNN